MEHKYDIAGYATKNDILCSDGRTIMKDAFADDDGKKVPVMWHHMHSDPTNVLGHAILENREDGVYARIKFNDTPQAKHAKASVKNEDIDSLSIFATRLVHSGANVIKGSIEEVSLVLVGANAGAKIDNVSFKHSDGSILEAQDEMVFTLGEKLQHSFDEEEVTTEPEEVTEEPVEETEVAEETSTDEEVTEEVLAHADEETGPTVGDVYNSMSDIQKEVVNAMIYQAAGGTANEVQHSGLEGDIMKNNLFETEGPELGTTLTHSQLQQFNQTAFKGGSSLRAVIQASDVDVNSILQHDNAATGAGVTYGITNLEYLLPDHKYISDIPTLVARDQAWVGMVMGGTKKTPFARIKSIHADITEEEARALGYIKGNLKKEEVFKLLKRTTSATTIYKKQKLDRDDVVDITDIDVIRFLKEEMQLMLREEQARAILIGDGRSASSPDKIKDPAGDNDGIGIRSIYHDDELYAHRVIATTNPDKPQELIKQIIKARKHYKGKGRPDMFMGTDLLTDLLLAEDTIGRRLYNSEAELATALRVGRIIEVGLMDGVYRLDDDGTKHYDLLCIMVNLNDYVVGMNPKGNTALFEDFDIDYNQMKYLLETRFSGALKDPKTAIIFETSLSPTRAVG